MNRPVAPSESSSHKNTSPEPWFIEHARRLRHRTVNELNSPQHCLDCGAMDPFGELVYGKVTSEVDDRAEVARIIARANDHYVMKEDLR